jgi:hypothetical protein
MTCTVEPNRDGRWKVVDGGPTTVGEEPKVVGIWNKHPDAVKDMHQRNGTAPPSTVFSPEIHIPEGKE